MQRSVFSESFCLCVCPEPVLATDQLSSENGTAQENGIWFSACINKYVPRDDLEVAHAVEEIVRVLTLVAGLGTANGGACEKHISFFECIPSMIVPSLS